MRTILTAPGEFSGACAGVIVSELRTLQANLGRDVNVVFATGRTMVDVLRALAVSPEVDWRRLQAFHLDEFAGLSPDHDASFGAWLDRHLFSQVAIPRENIHYMGAQPLRDYAATLKCLGGADLVLLGLGLDGHLAFNQPGSAFDSRARRVRLPRDVLANKAKEYPPIRRMPFADTLGLKDIMLGKHLLLLVNGATKAEIVAKVYFGPRSPAVPATVLRRHGQVTAILDSEAAAHLNALDVVGIAPARIRDQLALYSQTYSGIRYAGMGLGETVSTVDRVVAFLYGYAYGRLLLAKFPSRRIFHVLLGRDSRPTGRSLAASQAAGIRKALLEKGKETRIADLGVVTTPLLESAVRLADAQGAVMITASHNPIPHNGWKFMTANKERRGALLDEGALLDADESRTVIRTVRTLAGKMCAGSLDLTQFVAAAESVGPWPGAPPAQDDHALYRKALTFYTAEVAGGAGKLDKDLIVINDYNGGAAARVNVAVLNAMGFKNAIGLGAELGVCAHAIEPIGAAMDAVSKALVTYEAKIGVVYDFDADRGNLVCLKPDGSAAKISPQNIAALNVAIALLKHEGFDRRKYPKGLAVVGHCASSGSIRAIASRLKSAYFRVETGEVNVVKKMADLKRRGYLVAAGVEGYSGGSVFPGSQCRDGLRTLLAVTHLLSSQKMLGAWRRRLAAAQIPRHRRQVFVSELLGTLPRYTSLQDQITGIELEPREFRVELERRLKSLIHRSRVGWTVRGVGKTYASISIEYSGETKYYSKPITQPAGFGLRGRFEDGGWIARFVDSAGAESFLWARGSKTEAGIYKRLVDSSDPQEAAELKAVLDDLCAVGSRPTGGTTGNVLLIAPNGKVPSGWPSLKLPSRSRILLIDSGSGESPPAAECLLAALQDKRLGNRLEWLAPENFCASTLAERRPAWVISSGDKRVEEVVATHNREAAGPKTPLLLIGSANVRANCSFTFPKEVLRDAVKAIKAHKSQVRRTRYDLAVGHLCRAALLSLRAEGVAVPANHVGAYRFAALRWLGEAETVPPDPPQAAGLSGNDRVYFISPHPDDMEIAAGGLVSTLSMQRVPVQNLVLTLGEHGVRPTQKERRLLQRKFGEWSSHVGDLRREEVLRAAAILRKTPAGTVDCRIICEGYDEAALRRGADAEVARIFAADAARSRPGRLVFFLPHSEDDHPRHRLAFEVFSALIKRYSAIHRRTVEVFLYLSPWAGRSNAFFTTRQNAAYFKAPAAVASPEAVRSAAARARKRGLSYLVHELIGGFGNTRAKGADGERYATEDFFLLFRRG
ncbi:MAG TPA: 6-phosphogluconolactonase [bacterium]|nr:6-phosphogluconolactonase [bacterium]